MTLYSLYFQASPNDPPECLNDGLAMDEAMELAKKIMARLGHRDVCTIRMDKGHHVYIVVAPSNVEDLDECEVMLIADKAALDDESREFLH